MLGLIRDRKAVAAIEFAMVVPIMLVMFFGTVEFSSGVAVDRKVTLMAHTLSDLTSQSPTNGISDADIANFFAASGAIMTPYAAAPTQAIVSELYIDGTTTPPQARVQWSKGYQGGVARAPKSTVLTVPSALMVSGTYLIFSEVSYLYTPAAGYVMGKAGVKLSDVSFTRPRQSVCVIYPAVTTGSVPNCPVL
jgi:Flp pilus assembly protein TadG